MTSKIVIDWSSELGLALVIDLAAEGSERCFYAECAVRPEIVKIYDIAGPNCPYMKQSHYVANHSHEWGLVSSPARVPEARNKDAWLVWGGAIHHEHPMLLADGSDNPEAWRNRPAALHGAAR